MQNNRLWILMSRRLSGEASDADLQELQDLLEVSPDKQYLLDLLHTYFTAPPAEPAIKLPSGHDLDERFNRIVAVPVTTVRSLSRRWIGYAAAIAGLFLIGWGVFHLSRPPAPAAVFKPAGGGEIAARPGARTKLVLPDGTQVWLNSNSKLKYADDFNAHSREVVLEGEAYFDVVKDALHPFIVHSAGIAIKVLGTAFTVKSYPQDETVEATLLRGVIEVSRQGYPNTPRIILKPNEKLIYSKLRDPASAAPAHFGTSVTHPAAPDISVNTIPLNIPDSDKVETSWMYNKLVFNGDSFSELTEKMERWYNVRFVFKDAVLYKYHFGGVFTHESVQEALNALQLTAGFTYRVNKNEIDLYAK